MPTYQGTILSVNSGIGTAEIKRFNPKRKVYERVTITAITGMQPGDVIEMNIPDTPPEKGLGTRITLRKIVPTT